MSATGLLSAACPPDLGQCKVHERWTVACVDNSDQPTMFIDATFLMAQAASDLFAKAAAADPHDARTWLAAALLERRRGNYPQVD